MAASPVSPRDLEWRLTAHQGLREGSECLVVSRSGAMPRDQTLRIEQQ
jgi:hypothetical protein